MHVTAVLDAIKKNGHFLDYKKAEKVHKGAKKAVESARAGLSLLDSTGTKSKRFCKKKAREATEKALAKAQDSKSEAREAEAHTSIYKVTLWKAQGECLASHYQLHHVSPSHCNSHQCG
jgi:hypothetical protein